jgi:hypothetical protein
MPARKQTQERHWYNVLVFSYVDEAAAQEQIVTFERITAQSFYQGFSRQKAYAAISRAVLHASRAPLAFSVQVFCDDVPIIKVRVEH